MSVLNRKLFSQREARTKLRDMGGIMASSPELSGEVQRFQDGMMVRPQPRPDRAPQLVEPPATVPVVGDLIFEDLSMDEQRLVDAMASRYGVSREEAISRLSETGAFEPSPLEEVTPPGIGSEVIQPRLDEINPQSPFVSQVVQFFETPPEEESMEPDMEPEPETPDAITPERLEEETNAAISELTTALGDGDSEEDPDTLRSRYQQRLELFQEVFGSDEPTARDRAMQLAMIGLAIASGQSPNALQNIASGALAGMQAMSQQERERRNQQRELCSLAIESAMQDISEERRLTARDERATAQREAAIREAYDEAYREGYDLYDTAGDVPEGMSREEYAEQYAQASLARRFGTTPGTGAVTTDADLPVVTTQEEYDALPPGASFIQNGQVRRKPQS